MPMNSAAPIYRLEIRYEQEQENCTIDFHYRISRDFHNPPPETDNS